MKKRTRFSSFVVCSALALAVAVMAYEGMEGKPQGDLVFDVELISFRR